MKNRVYHILIIVVALFFGAAHAGQIYKWVDEHGNVHYGQAPQSESAKEMHIKIPKSSSSTDSTAASEQSKSSPEKEQSEGEGKDQESVAQREEETRKKNCQIAMKRLAAINAGGRLYEVNEKGERAYWDDNTRKAKLADAQKDVNEWCGEE